MQRNAADIIEATVPMASQQRGFRILVAEDCLINQLLARRLLEKIGYEVFVVGNGREAVEALEKNSFDLVLMDLMMPEMDGLTATRLIREGEGEFGFHIPILALTANTTLGDRERCSEVGMDGFIAKPIRAQTLLGEIEGLLSPRKFAQTV
ncbi:MAG TPA: hypothetical protein DD435_12330 [Cyanobacteria bacterium UBA8530]|nr:hypothetical protein [Cyanobacteria bacterium UBA8530]